MSQNEISVFEPNIDQIARFQSLQTGQYWRSLQDIAKQGIDAGEVLLIQSIRWVDDAPHTIILRPHPLQFGTGRTLRWRLRLQTESDMKFRWSEWLTAAALIFAFSAFAGADIAHDAAPEPTVSQAPAPALPAR